MCLQAHCGEQVVIGTALLGNSLTHAVVVACHILVAQAQAHRAKWQWAAEFHKEGIVVLALLGYRRRHHLLRVKVIVVAVGVAQLGACLQVATQHWP